MANRRKLAVAFVFSLSFVLIFVLWITFNVISGTDFIFTEPIYLFVLAITCVFFFITGFSMRALLFDIRAEINHRKEQEKNVRDFYRYDEFLNPPSMDN